MFENQAKSLILLHCERSELTKALQKNSFGFWRQKLTLESIDVISNHWYFWREN